MFFVLVGKIVASFGLQGWVKVFSLSDFPGRFLSGAWLWIGHPEQGWKEILVEEVTPRDKILLVRFQGVSSSEEAESLRGLFLAVPREAVSPLPENQFYQFELFGLVVREGESERGRVTSVVEGPAYDYLVVEDKQGREFLLPFIRVYVKEVNLNQGIIRVECPEGFWE
ncbi:MAG: ribosome maturation factor RimM [Atribacterota bacterium]